MSSFYFLKQKWGIIIIAFFIILSITLPQIALANWVTNVATGAAGGALIGSFIPGVGTVVGGIIGAATGFAVGGVSGENLAVQLAKLLVTICAGLFELSVTFFNYVANPTFLTKPITTDPIFRDIGWRTVRDFSNMFIVLGFVIIGIATILRISEYEAQKLLPKLIIIALLINFSPLICGIFIDASNITMSYFSNAGGGNLGAKIVDLLSTGQISRTFNDTEYLGLAAGASILSLMGAWAFINMAILLAARYVFLAILFITSPLAFFCWVFPKTKNLCTMWWNNFIRWCMVGIPAMFAMYIVAKMAERATVPDDRGFGIQIGFFFVAIVFIVVAVKISKQGAGMGATAALGLAAWVANSALGATKNIGGRMAKTALPLRTQEAIKSGATRLGERMGLVKPGTAAANQKAQLDSKERVNRLDSMTSKDLARVAERKGIGREHQLDRAKAIEILAKRNDLHEIAPANRETAVAHATSYGVKRSDLEKSDYRSAEFNNDRVQEVATTRNVAPAAARQMVRREQLEQNLSSMSGYQRRNIDVADLDEDLVTGGYFNANMVRDFRTADPARITQLQNLVGNPTTHPGGATGLIAAAQDARNRGNTSEHNRLISIITEINRLP